MGKRVIRWFCFLLVALCVPAQAQLRLLTEDAPPMSFMRDGEPRGLSVEVVRALQARTGDSGQIELMPWTRALHLAQQEEDIALFFTVRTPERENRFQWVGPIVVGTTSFYSLKSRELVIDTLEQAAASGPLALPKQWYTYETLSAKGFSNLYGVPSSKQMMTMLKHGRVNLIATEDLTLAGELAAVDLKPQDVRAHVPFMRSAYYIAFSPQTSVVRVVRWQRALQQMHEDGSLAAILRRWLPHAPMPPVEP
ncbi:polar amino acid transport system substrate-binding protein [Ectopseudomonas composti]|uniref:Polar amino acid transport system substrate-binding protein n=1 Tax=Ectopseudomonas composti TaxID=658457 RepID=A0A1I5JHH6_9GAMM|nr:transporter substrate-binding domain-containing protein [Pseudomonas composti]SFO71841.1 polar amino acid transport system substrate-binding protein [Pseudomonas composti]